MILRMTIGVLCLLFAAEEFVRAGPAAAEVVRRPGELMDALLAGDGSVGPWLLAAYGVLMLVRGWGHRPVRAAITDPAPGPPSPEDRSLG